MSNVTNLPSTKQQFSLTPQSLEEAFRFADMLSKSNMVPKDYQGNPANCIIAMQWGMEIGLQPLQAMQNIAVINGRPAIWGDAMLAIVRGSGLLEYITETPTDAGCTCKLKRKGEPEVERTFTLEDAKRAGLAGKQGPWQQHPKRMMQMRARAFALRDVFPDVLRGVHVAEIAQDEPVEKDMGAAEEVPKAAAATAPKSRADKVKAALADKRGTEEKVPAVRLDDLLREIAAASTPEAMEVAKQKASQMPEGDDKNAAREAYANRLADLKAQATQSAAVDAETGEIIDDAQGDFLAGYEAEEGRQ
ncbi:recombinase RecT [Aquabacterium sp.]|uniref:recombinase RecT n=1 Tax=Aquabacterium sp. TaxID=1872578 RepID=UPI0026299929|nr:recombinase RecT [Aquabacterium sp.]MDD2978270.1 recombinase RecT [Aquabacterium sp.]